MKAFTLIELIVTITIFAALSSLAMPIGITYVQDSDADNTARQIVNDLVELQQNSFSKKGKTFGSTQDICFGVDFTNVSSQRTYNTFDGTWNTSTNTCDNKNLYLKKLVGKSLVTPSVKNFLFKVGSFRPLTIGTVSISGSTVTGSGFSNGDIVSNQDSVAVLTIPTTCVTATVSNNTSITTSSNLNSGSGQTLIKCINLTVKNGFANYVVFVTDEGMIYYKKV